MAMWFSQITVMMLALLGCGSALAQWEKLPPMPRPSAGFALGADEGGITVIGGTNWVDGVKQWSAEISRFDPQALRWEVTGRLEKPLAYAVSDTRRKDGALVILGGSNGETAAQAFITVSNGSAVAAVVQALPLETVLSAGGLVGDTFIVVGGSDDAANIAGYTSHAFAWDLTRKTVTALPDYPGRPFGMAASAVAGGELWVFGGANGNPANGGIMNTGAAYAFSLAKKQWRALKACPLAVRGPAAVALDEHRVYLAGGWGGTPEGFVTAAFVYDGRTNDYTTALPLPYAATASLVRLGEYVYCLGGEDGPRQRSAAVWRVRLRDLLIGSVKAESALPRCVDGETNAVVPTAEPVSVKAVLAGTIPTLRHVNDEPALMSWTLRPKAAGAKVGKLSMCAGQVLYRVKYPDIVDEYGVKDSPVMYALAEGGTGEEEKLRPFFVSTTNQLQWIDDDSDLEPRDLRSIEITTTLRGSGRYWTSYDFSFTNEGPRLTQRSGGGRHTATKIFTYDPKGEKVVAEKEVPIQGQ